VIAAANGAAFLITTEASTPMYPTLALGIDGATGSIRWHVDVTKAPVGMFSGLLDNGTLYLGASDGGLYALAASDGSLRWHARFANIVPFVELVDQGVVYVSGPNQGLGAFNSSDGSLRWKYEKLDGLLFIISIMNGLIYACSLHFNNQAEQSVVFALHVDDASTLWSRVVGVNNIFPIAG
jgi:outer membrane protein assembly factor BamB